MGMTTDPVGYRDLPFAYLTTIGRRTGNPHTIEIWFALDLDDPTQLYMMAGGGWHADWVANLACTPAVSVKLGETVYPATARIVQPGEPDEPMIRRLLAAKYQGWRAGQPLSEWAQTALPVRYALNPAGASTAE